MGIFTRKFTDSTGCELEVDGSYRIVSHDQLEIIDYKAWRWADRENPDAPFVTLSDADDERLHAELCLDPSAWEYDDDPT